MEGVEEQELAMDKELAKEDDDHDVLDFGLLWRKGDCKTLSKDAGSRKHAVYELFL